MFDKLKEKLCRELEEIQRKPEMGAGDLELVHKLTDTIKNIEKICMMAQEGYSGWDGEDYGRGSSYANRGKHYVRGHYSRDDGNDGNSDGYSGRRGIFRGGRGGYSREDGKQEMMEHIQMAIDAAPEEYKEDFRRFMRQIENA